MRYSTQNAMNHIWKYHPEVVIRRGKTLYHCPPGGSDNTRPTDHMRREEFPTMSAAKKASHTIQKEGKGIGMGDVRVIN